MDVNVAWSRRHLIAGSAAALALAGCGRRDKAPPTAAAPAAAPPANAAPPVGSLAWAVAGDWRQGDARRDRWRHPVQTLEFFGLRPGQTVVEMWPGVGWYTEILAPYQKANGGKLYAATFETAPGDTASAQIVDTYKKMFSAKPDLYGQIAYTAFGPKSGPLAPAGSADLVLFMLTLHSWMAAGLAEKAFRDAFAALKPGGVLGVEAHRAEPGRPQDPLAVSGYVQEAYVRKMAEEAGFRFDKKSEINANPADTKDYPFGVETLPPDRRSAPAGAAPDPKFDHRRYDAIGESDRMTLRFVKPG
ncbi:MAG TPA: methyltransferase [Caulobacteraceae bacterium]|jgi:predicted methyltransferase|nr:methyltransferase [Caulobacteraceae bacterium]